MTSPIQMPQIHSRSVNSTYLSTSFGFCCRTSVAKSFACLWNLYVFTVFSFASRNNVITLNENKRVKPNELLRSFSPFSAAYNYPQTYFFVFEEREGERAPFADCMPSIAELCIASIVKRIVEQASPRLSARKLRIEIGNAAQPENMT